MLLHNSLDVVYRFQSMPNKHEIGCYLLSIEIKVYNTNITIKKGFNYLLLSWSQNVNEAPKTTISFEVKFKLIKKNTYYYKTYDTYYYKTYAHRVFMFVIKRRTNYFYL